MENASVGSATKCLNLDDWSSPGEVSKQYLSFDETNEADADELCNQEFDSFAKAIACRGGQYKRENAPRKRQKTFQTAMQVCNIIDHTGHFDFSIFAILERAFVGCDSNACLKG